MSAGDAGNALLKSCVAGAALIACVSTSATATAASAAQAQPYPTRPLRLIVPYPPGGGSDVTGRAIAERLSQQLHQQVIVDNRGGASTAIGADLAARAAADGYTPARSHLAAGVRPVHRGRDRLACQDHQGGRAEGRVTRRELR